LPIDTHSVAVITTNWLLTLTVATHPCTDQQYSVGTMLLLDHGWQLCFTFWVTDAATSLIYGCTYLRSSTG